MGRNNKGQFEMTCSFKDWCLTNGHQDWLGLWDYELNGLGPDEASFSSGKAWFKCGRGIHNSEAKTLGYLTSGRTHLLCAQCHSFGQWMIDNFGENAINLYYSDKNIYDWFSISVRSGKEIWIKCDNNTHPDYRTQPDRFTRGGRCPLCTNKKIVSGINDIATTHPHLVKYFKNPEDAKKYSLHSGKKTWFKCPLCGLERNTTVDVAFHRGWYSCDGCGDGVSYPNKFITAVLRQLHSKNKQIVFEREKTFDWAFVPSNKYSRVNGYKYYDVYLPTYNVIIENFGGQHYFQVNFNRSSHSKSLEEEQENDRIKYNLAIANGISKNNYIILDCRESNVEHIKSSIMESRLPEILGFSESDIDWDACDEFCFKDLSLQACILKNSGYSVKDIMNELYVAESTVYKYLRNGKKIGINKEAYHNGSPILCVENGLVCTSKTQFIKHSEDIVGVRIGLCRLNTILTNENCNINNYHLKLLSATDFDNIQKNTPSVIVG